MNDIIRCKRGDLFYTDFGYGVGSEQGGKRPAVIIQNDTGNWYSPTVIVAAITSKYVPSDKMPTHIHLPAGKGIKHPSTILLEQLRTVDKRRLGTYICCLDKNQLRYLDRALAISVGLSVSASAPAKGVS